MSAARNLIPPMSGRERKHFYRELAKAKSAHRDLVTQREAAQQNPKTAPISVGVAPLKLNVKERRIASRCTSHEGMM